MVKTISGFNRSLGLEILSILLMKSQVLHRAYMHLKQTTRLIVGFEYASN